MNDYEAMEAINAVLDQWFKSEVSEHDARTRIAYISGMNKISHMEAKQ
jgi:hypothetical protein